MSMLRNMSKVRHFFYNFVGGDRFKSGFLGLVPEIFLANCLQVVCLGQKHPVGFMPEVGLEVTVSQFLVWLLNPYTKLAVILYMKFFNYNLLIKLVCVCVAM